MLQTKDDAWKCDLWVIFIIIYRFNSIPEIARMCLPFTAAAFVFTASLRWELMRQKTMTKHLVLLSINLTEPASMEGILPVLAV